MDEPQSLPTELWLTTQLHTLSLSGIPYYIVNKGNHASGMVMVKMSSIEMNAEPPCPLYQQQRNIDGEMGWIEIYDDTNIAQEQVDAYIRRAIDRDPDLWVVEIENRVLDMPLEGKVF